MPTEGPFYPYPEVEARVEALQEAGQELARAMEAHGLPLYAEVVRGAIDALTMQPAADRGLLGEPRAAYLGARESLEALIELKA